ncbi:MAG: MurR/RpiR family transcriptional regulator [Candidatus Aminicenantales bacterium]
MLKEEIIKKFPDLPQKEKIIGDYIIKNSRSIFTHSVVELAENTGTSPATVVRFARHIGYSGFHQLRAQMINEVKEELMPEERFELLTYDENKVSICMKVAEQEVQNINQTLNGIDKEKYEVFVDFLRKGRCIHMIGIGISSLLARLSAYLLNQAGATTHFCARDEISFIERLINMKKSDVVLGFSFPPYSMETIKTIKFCFERGLKCLAITDQMSAPIVRWAHHCLFVQTKNLMFTNSISAVSMIINAMATELALLNKRKLLDKIDLINRMSKEEYFTLNKNELDKKIKNYVFLRNERKISS